MWNFSLDFNFIDPAIPTITSSYFLPAFFFVDAVPSISHKLVSALPSNNLEKNCYSINRWIHFKRNSSFQGRWLHALPAKTVENSVCNTCMEILLMCNLAGAFQSLLQKNSGCRLNRYSTTRISIIFNFENCSYHYICIGVSNN